MEITIKPHHFMDIIKLYGSGIEVFVPDEKMKHDFYKIANMILKHHDCIDAIWQEEEDGITQKKKLFIKGAKSICL